MLSVEPNRHTVQSASTRTENENVTTNVCMSGDLRTSRRSSHQSAASESTTNREDVVDVEGASSGQHEEFTVPSVRRMPSSMVAVPPYSVFTRYQKRFIVFMASWAGLFSPISSSIYFPALNALAADLNVSDSMINLTLTAYMIFQGLAPAFMGNLADSVGRRPAYTICFIIYTAANIGLALQDSYAALFVLRCLQSTGASATIAMASAVVSDLATPAERGGYIGLVMAGSLIGPAIGPVLGGIFAEFLGWRSIFWFLVIFTGVFMVVFLIFFPETARTSVGDGSIPPIGWNMSLMNYLAVRKTKKQQSFLERKEQKANESSTQHLPKKKMHFPNPLASLFVILDKENALLLFYTAFLYSALFDMITILPSQLSEIFHFNELQIGLCFIPFGVGSVVAALANGQLLDRNFARWCRKYNVEVKKGRNQDLKDFPIEKARLEVAIPASYFAAAFILAFGWVLNNDGPLAVLLVLLFFASFAVSIAFNVTGTLLVDFYPNTAATASAANNLVRCLLGAGATALVLPMIDAMGRGWTFTFLALVLTVSTPMVWAVYFFGMKWREERRMREERKKQGREEKHSRVGKSEQGQSTS